MVAFMDARPQAGAAGPKLVRLDGSLDKACRRSFPTPTTSLYHLLKLDRLFPHSRRFARYDLSYLDPDVVTRVDGIVGAFMLVRREAIVEAGLLDEIFFMYGEDLDWAKRITDAGWEVWYNPQVTVLHIKEAASRHSYRARVEFYRALTLFYEKHYQATTPFYLDWAIRGGVWFFGGLDLLMRRLRGQYARTIIDRRPVPAPAKSGAQRHETLAHPLCKQPGLDGRGDEPAGVLHRLHDPASGARIRDRPLRRTCCLPVSSWPRRC